MSFTISSSSLNPEDLHRRLKPNDKLTLSNGEIVCLCADQSIDILEKIVSDRPIRVHKSEEKCECSEKFTQVNTINVSDFPIQDKYIDMIPEGFIITAPKDIDVMSGLSILHDMDGNNLKIPRGYPLVLCKNQYIDRRDFAPKGELGNKTLRCHFVLDREGHYDGCACGSCGYKHKLRIHPSGECSCEKLPPINPADQACCIM